MRTRSSDTLSRGQRGRSRLNARLQSGRNLRFRWLNLEGLENRLLLATIPAATATGAAKNLSNLSSVTTSGNANSPAVVVDPFDSQNVFAVWGVDLSQVVPEPSPTTAIVEGAYSNDAGANWYPLGTSVAPVQLDPLTINNKPPTKYTQVTDPSVGFDGQGNVYVLSLQTSGSADGELYLTKFNFAGSAPSLIGAYTVYQWVTNSDAATSPVLAVDAAHAGAPGTPDPYANNVYIAWASIDQITANPNTYPNFNPNRAELVVGTPISSPSGNEESLAFSGVTTVNAGGNVGGAANKANDDSHPQLVINQNDGGQVTVAWDDFGSGTGATPYPYDNLMSNLVQPGDSYGFSGSTGPVQPAQSISSSSTQGDWAAAKIYDAGPSATSAADPTSIAIGAVGTSANEDIVVTDKSANSQYSGIGVLINQGGGVFPAAGVTAQTLYSAGSNPASVALADLVPGHTVNTILDAAVANDSGVGGVSILENGTPPNDGQGTFQTVGSLNTTPAQSGTAAVVVAPFDGTSQDSVVAINSVSDSISLFPDGSSTSASVISTAPFSPIAVAEANFRGPSTLPDLVVLYSNGDIQFFVNNSPGPGNLHFAAGQLITGLNVVAITAGTFGGAALPDVAYADSNGDVNWLNNTSTMGGATVSFNTTPTLIGTVIGTPVALAAGQLSTKGNYVAFQDVAVLYRAPATSAEPNESMVAVFQNDDNGTFTHTGVPGTGADFDAGDTYPTAIALGYLTNSSATPWEDIVVTSNENNLGRGTISVLQPTPLPTTTTTTPSTTSFSDSVNVPNPNAIDNLTVSVGLVDQQSVQNLELVLVAPNGASIELVANQNNVAGQANTGQGLPSGNAIGVYGFTTGTTGTPGTVVGTIFDDNATRNIFDANAAGTNGNSASADDYIGYFRPEFGSLSGFVSSLGSAINGPGPWRLLVTNYSSTVATGIAVQAAVREFSLQFSTAMSAGSQHLIAQTYVTGALGNTYALKPPSSPNVGVGPGLVLAIDNTLGSGSPYAGTIYAAYVGYQPNMDPNGHVNPTSNTDIYLAVSTNGGASWVNRGVVNDDNSDLDGYSGAQVDGTFGRTQFQPAIAVDQASGTLVISWRDARDDAANARVATYTTASIDQGQTFSPQTYANPESTATDAITGQIDVLGPESDNQSAGNHQADAMFGYGDQMGLAVFDGQVYPVWAGNLNQSYDNNGTVTAFPLNIWYRPMAIAAGPRIINSSMGPIPLTEAAMGSVSISVTFDRAIIPTTFRIGNVSVYYHKTSPISASNPYVPLTVTGVSAVPGSGNTEFTITFNPTPPGDNPATYNYTGTYSYLIAPDSGPGTTPISAPVESYIYNANLGEATLRAYDPDDQNADGTSDENALTTSFTGQTPGDVYAVPAPQIPSGSETTTYLGAPSILQPTFGQNTNTLPLIVPGPQVLSTSVPGGNSAAGNLITDGTTSSLNVTFDRPMLVNTAPAGQTPTPGSFTAADVQSIMGPAGSISLPQSFPSDVQTGQAIPASGTLDSTLTIPSFGGTFTIADITVSLTAAFSPDSDLTAVLIAPNGMQVPLFSGVGGSGSNFSNTVLDDAAETSITAGAAPFTGSYKPTGMLSTLDGLPVDFKNSFGLWVPGVWTLELTSSATSPGMLDNWSLSITPQISVTPVASSESANGTAATQFQIGFPLQQLSGTYTVQLGPNILDAFGDALDTNQNAGLNVLRDTDQNGPTTTVKYPSGDLPKSIPAPAAGSTSSTVSSTITVPDNFIIEGDRTAAGASVMQVQINLTYPTDPDLTATLTHYAPGGNELGTVTLFSDVGAGVTTANFQNTVFDDNSGTPIQEGSAPFFGTFDPQQSLATAFAPAGGVRVQGTWVLSITNNSTTGGSGKFNSWSLTFQKPLPTTGLGEPGADNYTASFRIFTLSQTDQLSSEAWSAVGPASIGGGANVNGSDPSGRVTGLAIDSSDPSGNTVYAAGASGGIWKTTDFLTTSPAGPTWIPLTDFGPTSGVNIGGIAVFPRNDDPNQSIIVAATGEGDTGTPGVGFLISENGGATWILDDSTDNVDANGNELPINSSARDRVFVGDSAYQVVVDPEPSPTGGVIIYAALSGPTGGIWRSENTGATWQQMLAGQATSVVADPESGLVLNASTGKYAVGNLQVIYAGIRGEGVFMSPNQGQVWNQMLGGIGNPLIFNSQASPHPNVNPVNGPTPNGAEGRIELAVPDPTGNVAEDAVYEGWLYAVVATPGGTLDGIFVTKDFGQNWTQVRIPTEPNEGYQTTPAIPTNDVGLSDYSVIGNATFPQGNYNIAIATDPTDPSVIYIGGTADGNQTGLIRINLTDIWDAHNLNLFSYDANDGGQLTLSSTGPATLANTNVNQYPPDPAPGDGYLNLIRNPGDPFVNDASVYVYNYGQFTNNGAGVEWIPFDVGGTDYHRIVTMVDPTTGLPRLIFGNDQGIWSVLDNNGTFETSVGQTASGVQTGSSYALPGNSRNGNLQITQFYYGAAQPSNAAALIAGALYYGAAQDNGGPYSPANVISSGNIVWNGPGGDSGAVATNQQGTGTLYQYWGPCCGGRYTDFFQVNGVGETYGLIQASGGQPNPDPQWAGWPTTGSNFAVDPVNGQDIVISSNVGRIFTTSNGGVTWFDVGDPAVFGNPGTWSVALAYGAPDPTAPSGIGNLGNFIYVGTQKGQVYVTQNGGGSGTSNNWLNISLGLDGSPVQQIITDPTRGSHDAYAVTRDGVYYLADSILLADNPTNTAYEWVNITGNLQKLAYSIFGQNYDPTKDPHSSTYAQAVDLSSIVADWRYAIPNSTSYSNGPTYHPVLYVGAGDAFGTGSGVFQSLDGGNTWTYFPDTTYGAVVEGGYLPHVAVTSLSLSLGDINVDTGMPTLDGPDAPYAANQTTALNADPDTLMAATYGQGAFAINLAPLIVGNTVTVVEPPGTSGPPVGSNGLPIVTGPITISGTSEITGFGNATWISIVNDTLGDPDYGQVIAGFNPANGVPVPSASNSTNALGNFSININPETAFATDHGVKTIEIYATDNAGSVGNKVTYTFDLNPASQLVFNPTGEPPASATAGMNFASPVPVVVDAEDTHGAIDPFYNGPVTLTLALAIGANGTFPVTVNAVSGVATFSNLAIDTAGTYVLQATSDSLTPATSTSITISAAAPAQLVWVTQPPSKITVNNTFGATLDVQDQYGNPETGYTGNVSVALELNGSPASSDLSGMAAVPAVNGVAAFTGLSISAVGSPYTLVATTKPTASQTLTSLPSANIDVVAPQLVVTTQPSIPVTAGAGFELIVKAETFMGTVDAAYNDMLGLAISSGPNGGTIGGTTTATAVNGVATFSGVILDIAGPYILQASDSNLNLTVDTNTITVVAAGVNSLVFVQEPPAMVQTRTGFGLVVGGEDQYGNTAPLSGNVTVQFKTNPVLGATLGGMTTVLAANGVATFSGLTISSVGNGYTLVATSAPTSSTTLTSPPSTPIDATPTPAVALEVTEQPPSSVMVYQTFGIQVSALDQSGKFDPDFNGSITVGLGGGSGVMLGGTMLTETAVNGVATFSGLFLTTVANGYTLVATSPGLTSATSNSFNVTAAPASQLVLFAQPVSSVTAGTAFGFVVAAEDQYGNLATSFNGSVTAAIAAGPSGGTLGGMMTATASDGVAVFSGLIIDKAGTGYTLQASSTGLTSSPPTSAFAVTAAPASQFVITPASAEPPANVTAGETFGLTVTAEDPYGNLAMTFNSPVFVALSANPSTGALGGNLMATASKGQAVFTDLQLDIAASGYTIKATSGSLTPAISTPIAVAPAAASALVVSIPPPTTMTSGALFGLQISAQDPYGNLATSFTGAVTLALVNNPGDAMLTGPLKVNATAGVANFKAAITTDIAATGYTLEATSPGLTPVTTGGITVIPSPATMLLVTTQPPSAVTPGAAFGLVVAAEDQHGNVDPSFTGNVTVALPSGSTSTLGGKTTVAVTDGLATFTGLTLTASSTPVSLQVTSTGLTPTMTNSISVTTPTQLAFSASSVSVKESVGTETIDVVRTGGYQGAVSVNVATSGGTAVAGKNYTAINKTVNFAANQDSQTVTIPILNVGVLSSSRTFNVVLSSPGANATLGSPSTETVTIQSSTPPPPPLVTLESVHATRNSKGKVTQIVLDFSGAVNMAEAQAITTYDLIEANKSGSFTGKGTTKIKIKSSVYKSANDSATLTTAAFGLSRPVELVVYGNGANGLMDAEGRYIDGADNGVAGSNAVAIITKGGATVSAVPAGPLAVKSGRTRR